MNHVQPTYARLLKIMVISIVLILQCLKVPREYTQLPRVQAMSIQSITTAGDLERLLCQVKMKLSH